MKISHFNATGFIVSYVAKVKKRNIGGGEGNLFFSLYHNVFFRSINKNAIKIVKVADISEAPKQNI